jgi:hypothetical protein
MIAGEAALIELATAKCHKLTDAHKKFLQSIANGKFAQFGEKAALDNNPQYSDNWSPSRTIYATSLSG